MTNSLGDRMKSYEKMYSGDDYLMPLIPALARLDGRAFHSFTVGLEKPSERMSQLMGLTTRFLMEETGALIGYTESDEITLAWHQPNYSTQMMFGGRVQKLIGALAATASVFFNKRLPEYIPEKADKSPILDCRVWSLPNREEVANCIIWRQQDCTRNSISMLAQSKFSHKELLHKSCDAMQEMLFQHAGINWSEQPEWFKNGRLFVRKQITRPFTVQEIESLPERHHARQNPAGGYSRVILEESSPVLTKIEDRVNYLFG